MWSMVTVPLSPQALAYGEEVFEADWRKATAAKTAAAKTS